MTRERHDVRVTVAEKLVLLWAGVGVLALIALTWRKGRIKARPELRDTNLPKARVRPRDP